MGRRHRDSRGDLHREKPTNKCSQSKSQIINWEKKCYIFFLSGTTGTNMNEDWKS